MMSTKAMQEHIALAESDASAFTTFDDFLSALPRPQETAVIGGRTLYFEGMSAEKKDNLIAAHSKDDGMGNVSVENKGWRTNVIKQAWVVAFGKGPVLDSKEKADRFYTTIPAQIEQQMYEVAARVSGLGEVDKRRKNSENGGGTSTSHT
jgi:hypothetical protein